MKNYNETQKEEEKESVERQEKAKEVGKKVEKIKGKTPLYANDPGGSLERRGNEGLKNIDI